MTVLVLVACSPKYSTIIDTVIDGSHRGGSVEEVKFFPASRLGNPNSRYQIQEGDGNCLIVTATCRGETTEDDFSALLAYDQYLVYRIFMQIPDSVQMSRHNLIDSSFVQLSGMYQVPAEDKIFFPDSGYVEIVEIDGSRMYARFDGHFRNTKGETLSFSGNFRTKFK